VSCDQCHPDASNVHPETYLTFQQQLGKVAVLGEMINWCPMNPLESEPLALDAPDMVDLQAYIHYECRGVPLAPGKH
jgi:thiosulfate dehydrogenase